MTRRYLGVASGQRVGGPLEDTSTLVALALRASTSASRAHGDVPVSMSNASGAVPLRLC